jgi:hypothetical protein
LLSSAPREVLTTAIRDPDEVLDSRVGSLRLSDAKVTFGEVTDRLSDHR